MYVLQKFPLGLHYIINAARKCSFGLRDVKCQLRFNGRHGNIDFYGREIVSVLSGVAVVSVPVNL